MRGDWNPAITGRKLPFKDHQSITGHENIIFFLMIKIQLMEFVQKCQKAFCVSTP